MTTPPASTGRIPDRTDPTKPAEGVTRITALDHEFLEDAVVAPPVNPRWHPLARGLYLSLGKSGQSVLYEPSDWAMAYIVCESLSRDLRPQFVGMTGSVELGQEPHYEVVPLRGASMTAYLRALAVLGVAEGDRRRLRIEVERGKAHTGLATVTEITQDRAEALSRRSVG